MADVSEESKAYNAEVITKLENELMGPIERERLGKAPAWVKSLVTELIRRIANLRAQVSQLEQERDALRSLCVNVIDDIATELEPVEPSTTLP